MKTETKEKTYERLFKETGLRISTIQDIKEAGRQEELIREERRYKLTVNGYRSAGPQNLEWLLQDKKKRPSRGFVQWLDHSEGWIVGERRELLTEGKRELHTHPYQMYLEDFKSLIKKCEENDLTFTIDTYSDHSPGHSLRIILTKRESRGTTHR
jgi:hypothetical protein